MSPTDHYLMTVALHATGLSAAVFLAVVCFRKPQRIALVALCGTMAVAILPWVSALRPRPSKVEEPAVQAVASLPQWTVIRIPTVETPAVAAPASRSLFAMPEVPPVVAIWALGSLIAVGALLTAVMKVLRWERTLAKPDDAAWQAILEATPDVPARRHFRISPAEGSPCVAGFFKPFVMIPLSLLDPTKRRELRWALRHELRHWQGSDSRWTMALEWIRISQWWNPFVPLLIARWKMAREFICDLAASGEDRSAYGEFLIEMAARPSPRHPLAVTMVQHRRLKTLRARLVAVLKAAPGNALPFEKSVLFAACLALPAASLMISCVGIGDRGTGTDSRGEAIATATAIPDTRSRKLPAGMTAHVKISTKFLFPSGAPAAADGSVLSAAEMQQLMRKFAHIKGTKLMNMPTVTARIDEAAMIELIHQHPDDPPWIADYEHPQLRKNRFAGWSLLIAPSYDGKKIRFAADIGYGFVPGKHYSANTRAASPLDEDSKIAWSKLVRKNASGAARLAPGETLAIDLGEVERGLFATAFMTVTPIDATGREKKSFEAAIYKPDPPKEEVSGKVRLKGFLLEDFEDVPHLKGDEATRGIASVFNADQWNLVKDEIGGKPLGEFVMETGREAEPWKELPGVRLGARRYKGERGVELQFTFQGITQDDRPFSRSHVVTCNPGTAILSDLESDSSGKHRCLIVILEELR